MTSEPFGAVLEEMCAKLVYSAEIMGRLDRKHPHLTVGWTERVGTADEAMGPAGKAARRGK
jgi:hypothetical protein